MITQFCSNWKRQWQNDKSDRFKRVKEYAPHYLHALKNITNELCSSKRINSRLSEVSHWHSAPNDQEERCFIQTYRTKSPQPLFGWEAPDLINLALNVQTGRKKIKTGFNRDFFKSSTEAYWATNRYVTSITRKTKQVTLFTVTYNNNTWPAHATEHYTEQQAPEIHTTVLAPVTLHRHLP